MNQMQSGKFKVAVMRRSCTLTLRQLADSHWLDKASAFSPLLSSPPLLPSFLPSLLCAISLHHSLILPLPLPISHCSSPAFPFHISQQSAGPQLRTSACLYVSSSIRLSAFRSHCTGPTQTPAAETGSF